MTIDPGGNAASDPSRLLQPSAEASFDEKVNILIVDDRPDKLLALETALDGAEPEHRAGAFRKGGASLSLAAGIRGDPAGREHAGHGRIRDGVAHPAAPAFRD